MSLSRSAPWVVWSMLLSALLTVCTSCSPPRQDPPQSDLSRQVVVLSLRTVDTAADSADVYSNAPSNTRATQETQRDALREAQRLATYATVSLPELKGSTQQKLVEVYRRAVLALEEHLGHPQHAALELKRILQAYNPKALLAAVQGNSKGVDHKTERRLEELKRKYRALSVQAKTSGNGAFDSAQQAWDDAWALN